jgi:hypothetical protein
MRQYVYGVHTLSRRADGHYGSSAVDELGRPVIATSDSCVSATTRYRTGRPCAGSVRDGVLRPHVALRDAFSCSGVLNHAKT